MDRASLLWVQTGYGTRDNGSCAEFSRHCDARPIDRHNLWATVALATSSDVICFDFDHPDITCLKLVADTKAKFPSVPILLLLAQQSADIMLWALRMRVFDVLVKPLASQDVERCLQRLAPVLAARRTQQARSNATGSEAIPNDARFRARPSARDRLQAAFDYIAKRFAHPISELDVAKVCGMSPFGFSRAFRAAQGITFRDYLCDYRLTQSKRLLAGSSASIADIAAMSGFGDASYFARQFRKRLGVSPSDFRDSRDTVQREAAVETA